MMEGTSGRSRQPEKEAVVFGFRVSLVRMAGKPPAIPRRKTYDAVPGALNSKMKFRMSVGGRIDKRVKKQNLREAPEDNDLRGVNSTSYIVHVSVLADHETSSKQYGCDRIENVKVDLWRRLQSAPVRRVEALVVDGLRRKGRTKLRWEDRLTQDMKDLLLSEDMTLGMRGERELTFAGSVV
ncbi:hypothetical protein Tco_1101673 [Tanacetum coccineum]